MTDVNERISDATLKVFISEGYVDTTTRKIAQEAKVTEMTVIEKFQSKENLFREARKKNPNAFLKYWDEAYKGTPPWDIDHPQPAFQALIKAKEIKPCRALDIGTLKRRKRDNLSYEWL
jgi:AcrR family transcriptional regulator